MNMQGFLSTGIVNKIAAALMEMIMKYLVEIKRVGPQQPL
jgi:hypothetical protein